MYDMHLATNAYILLFSFTQVLYTKHTIVQIAFIIHLFIWQITCI